MSDVNWTFSQVICFVHTQIKFSHVKFSLHMLITHIHLWLAFFTFPYVETKHDIWNHMKYSSSCVNSIFSQLHVIGYFFTCKLKYQYMTIKWVTRTGHFHKWLAVYIQITHVSTQFAFSLGLVFPHVESWTLLADNTSPSHWYNINCSKNTINLHKTFPEQRSQCPSWDKASK